MSPAEPPGAPGTRFQAEIREQPAALRRLLEHDAEIARIAATVRERDLRLVRMVGHGSSDNAASFGVYAFGLMPRWTALRDSITLTVHYRTPLDMSGSTVVGLSQSGQTPDVLEYVRRARAAGAFTIALTNDPGVGAGHGRGGRRSRSPPSPSSPWRRRRRTSTRSARSRSSPAHLAGRGAEVADGIRGASELMEEAIPELERTTSGLARSFSYTGRMFVIGRGVEFATAREIALKLLETCRIAAEPLTATDLAHGPVAALDPLFPVWAIASSDNTLQTVKEAAARARRMGATVVASGTAAERVKGAAFTVPVPTPRPALLSPLLSVVPGQLFCAALSQARGLDSDAPHGLAKVTLAR